MLWFFPPFFVCFGLFSYFLFETNCQLISHTECEAMLRFDWLIDWLTRQLSVISHLSQQMGSRSGHQHSQGFVQVQSSSVFRILKSFIHSTLSHGSDQSSVSWYHWLSGGLPLDSSQIFMILRGRVLTTSVMIQFPIKKQTSAEWIKLTSALLCAQR